MRKLSPLEEAALARIANCHSLLAFDFDGTLAPIVASPADAVVPESTAAVLASLAQHYQVAIVTGRRIDDVRPRLGFCPWRIIGNHGAECITQPLLAKSLALSLDGFRDRVQSERNRLSALGVAIEDKAQSIAFHYRQAGSQPEAMSAIHGLLAGVVDVHVFGGKHVVNVAPAGAPDKAQAVMSLLAQSGAEAVLYAGDDINDEPVFTAAPDSWLTVHVGNMSPTQAKIRVESPEAFAAFLRRLLELYSSERTPRL